MKKIGSEAIVKREGVKEGRNDDDTFLCKIDKIDVVTCHSSRPIYRIILYAVLR